ncbi:hypothetical protein P168DRAFT_75178 [Aspergillus campestris IBT 28561]|uniref:Uncharacterized protein n=1 Tax=Aspergillus campestris (strain IBT 28561) TaxID=1392248 RepID=A0A2I1CRN2_ASPC2|nr:uncharacterized protein P168DRAFT_75178 [Aspergillus campestris IBT 28561]PKY00268.1 hypothetical protein P168DRAFT_75178 [Aspergillus campestris IBT 28561]
MVTVPPSLAFSRPLRGRAEPVHSPIFRVFFRGWFSRCLLFCMVLLLLFLTCLRSVRSWIPSWSEVGCPDRSIYRL